MSFLILFIVAMLEITLVSLCGIFKYDKVMVGYRFLENTTGSFDIVYKIVFGLDIFLCVVYFLPVCFLTQVQIVNLFLGRTTY